jgi:hypothetical protein
VTCFFLCAPFPLPGCLQGRYQGLQEYSSAVLTPSGGGLKHQQLLGDCGIHDCKSAFCAGALLRRM